MANSSKQVHLKADQPARDCYPVRGCLPRLGRRKFHKREEEVASEEDPDSSNPKLRVKEGEGSRNTYNVGWILGTRKLAFIFYCNLTVLLQHF
jgi:hypothetical protein